MSTNTAKIAPMTKVVELEASNYEMTADEKEWYTQYLLSQKDDTVPFPTGSKIDERFAQLKHLRRVQQNVLRGMKYTTRIIDRNTKKVLYDSPMMHSTEFHADRCGQRLIKRFELTGSFTR